uniref:Cytochrome c oxidase assembly factor COX14 n=1 Tax=Salvator merianae TaxID=96440 RepID=A0A8D0C0N1_SALMN
MVSAKQLADFGYKTVSGSMMLLTLYAGYLCSAATYHYFQTKAEQKRIKQQEMNTAAVKD